LILPFPRLQLTLEINLRALLQILLGEQPVVEGSAKTDREDNTKTY